MIEGKVSLARECWKGEDETLDRDTGNLLRAVVRSGEKAVRETFAELATKISCWEETIEGALQHGVLPMLYFELAAKDQPFRQRHWNSLESNSSDNAFHCLTNAAELLKVLNAFEKAGIAAMPFKGVVLGAAAYGDMTARTAGDLDVLIYLSRFACEATRILQKRGYELTTKVLEDGSPEAENYFEYHFERADDGMVLELRWRLELTQPRYRHDLGMDWVWPRRRTVKLAGADVPNLDPVSGLLILCMHGSKHVWSRLIWICRRGEVDRKRAGAGLGFRAAGGEARGIWRCLALECCWRGALRVRRFLPRLYGALRGPDGARLADFLQENIFEEPGKLPEGWVPYSIQILDFGIGLACCVSPSFLRPNARDRAVVKLPKSLEALYYVIRPFRMLLDRSSR